MEMLIAIERCRRRSVQSVAHSIVQAMGGLEKLKVKTRHAAARKPGTHGVQSELKCDSQGLVAATDSPEWC
eukprot:3750138-Pyramimonas_sp.AAC.1